MTEHDDIVARVLAGFDVPASRQDMVWTGPSDETPTEGFARRGRITKHLRRLSQVLQVPVRATKDLADLGATFKVEDTPDNTEILIRVRPARVFLDRRWYELVVLHEFSHVIFAALRQHTGVARWTAARTQVVGAPSMPPRRIMEEIIVELSAILTYRRLVPSTEAKVFDPCYMYLREQLGAMSRYGLPWHMYPPTVSYGLAKAQVLSDALLRVAAL